MDTSLQFTVSQSQWQAIEPAVEGWFTSYQNTAFDSAGQTNVTIFYTQDEMSNAKDIVSDILSRHDINTDIKTQALPDKDWLQHVHDMTPPLHIGSFWVAGNHVTETPPDNAIVLRLDAAAAFGTGQHATTAGCLRAIEDLSPFSDGVRILDMGCGSAILSLAAERLGAQNIIGVEIDPRAANIARDNVKAHNAENAISIITSDGVDETVKSNAPYDVVIANILAEPLMALAQDLSKVMSDNGTMILSGLLQTQQDQIKKTYGEYGLQVVKTYPQDEWQTLVLRRG